MIVAGSGGKVVVATRPVDFRKGHDGQVASAPCEKRGLLRRPRPAARHARGCEGDGSGAA